MAEFETYTCTRCDAEVPWYEPGDPCWRKWEFDKKVCSRCRREKLTPEEREGVLPKPARPCACGSVEFLRAPLQEHVGEYRELKPLHMASGKSSMLGAIYVLACRQCGLATLWVPGISRIPIDPAVGTELVRFEPGGPYR